MATKPTNDKSTDDKAHAKAFEKGTDADKLAATSEQYQEQTGQGDVETGPDPIVAAQEKAAKEADVEEIRDQAQVREDLEKEEKAAWDESTPPSEPEGDAKSRAKDEEKKAKDDA